MKFSSDPLIEESTIEINITPMVDVVFNLLIFFMVTTTFAQVSGIDVKLPASKSTKTENITEDIIVTMNTNGEIFLKDRKIDLEELARVISEAVKRSANSTLVVRADRDALHGMVVYVMDLAKEKGVSRIAIATQPTARAMTESP